MALRGLSIRVPQEGIMQSTRSIRLPRTWPKAARGGVLHARGVHKLGRRVLPMIPII